MAATRLTATAVPLLLLVTASSASACWHLLSIFWCSNADVLRRKHQLVIAGCILCSSYCAGARWVQFIPAHTTSFRPFKYCTLYVPMSHGRNIENGYGPNDWKVKFGDLLWYRIVIVEFVKTNYDTSSLVYSGNWWLPRHKADRASN